MMLRPHRRNLVIWSSSADLADRYGGLRFTGLARPRPIRWCIRNGALLVVIGMVRLARAVRPRWLPLLAGGVLTVVGVILRSGPGGVALLPGLLFLVLGLLISLPLSLGTISIGTFDFNLYWMLLGVTLAVLGLQSFYFGCLAQVLLWKSDNP